MTADEAILQITPLGFPWQTADPFLFCVHHDDAYPAGNDALGPDASLEGRQLGQDFAGKDGWRMYHGDVVPGFPQHPHRGFETVTIVRRGLVDHSDSLGAAARFGHGDVQWLTAGRGIVHSEMFPLLERERDNPVELFQIWLNLPRAHKLAEPHFSIFWARDIPHVEHRDPAGRRVTVSVIAGHLGDRTPPPPPPQSWASLPDTDVAIWTLRLDAGASWTLPAAQPGTHRVLYFFKGEALDVAGRRVPASHAVAVRPDVELHLAALDADAEVLVLQGRPIGETVAQYGPFVMNSREEIQQAFADYQQTRFGGWPWPSDGPVHERTRGRFARYADGRTEDGQ